MSQHPAALALAHARAVERAATLNLKVAASCVVKHPKFRDGPNGYLADLALALEWADAAEDEAHAAALRYYDARDREEEPVHVR